MSEQDRIQAIRNDRLATFLEGQKYPTKYPGDPSRILWASYIALPSDPEVKREIFSVRPTDNPVPSGLSDTETYEAVRQYPMLVMPFEIDFAAVLESQSKDWEPVAEKAEDMNSATE